MIAQLRAFFARIRARGGVVREETLKGCGHSPHVEKPAEFRALVTAFLADNGGAS
jgi:pimeloyl-ACP methyl ester carboxylesterase